MIQGHFLWQWFNFVQFCKSVKFTNFPWIWQNISLSTCGDWTKLMLFWLFLFKRNSYVLQFDVFLWFELSFGTLGFFNVILLPFFVTIVDANILQKWSFNPCKSRKSGALLWNLFYKSAIVYISSAFCLQNLHTCKTHLPIMEGSKMLTLHLKSFCKFTSNQVNNTSLVNWFFFFVTRGASKCNFPHINL